MAVLPCSSCMRKAASAAASVSVTVGQAIDGTDWPAWSNLVGVTFAQLGYTSGNEASLKAFNDALDHLRYDWQDGNGDPVTSTKALFRSGMTFCLPAYEAYSRDLGAARPATFTALPDYASGTTITMYGVFHEQRLVFVERYIDHAGEHERVRYSGSAESWCDVTGYTAEGNSDITSQGFKFLGWYVNTPNYVESARYVSQTGYADVKETYKSDALANGTYDVLVYTVYMVQETQNGAVTARTDPTGTNETAASFTVSRAFLADNVTYGIELGTGLKLTTASDLRANRYKNTWESYSANDTIAVVLEHGGASYDITESGGSLTSRLEPGASVTVKVYHSQAISASGAKDFTLTLSSTSTQYAGQRTAFHVTTNFEQTKYEVTYEVTLEEDQSELALEKNGFTGDGRTLTKTVKEVPYGGALLGTADAPTMEGYTFSGGHWSCGGNALTEDKLTAGASQSGAITLTGGYTANGYTLTLDAATAALWSVSGNGTALTGAGTLTVPYHAQVRFTQKSAASADRYAEFVALTIGDEATTLLARGEESESGGVKTYAFRMPANGITTGFVNEKTLYLDDGSISLGPAGYTQTGAEGATWHGHYSILENAGNAATGTRNRLTLSGDLTGRRIELGNLYIDESDSIVLTAGAKAALRTYHGETAS